MFKIGCHMSAAAGYEKMGKDAVAIGANTLQFFTRNPRGGRAKAIDEADIQKYLQIAREHHFAPIVG